MVEVLAVLRTVEQKFGPIAEYAVSKDFEMPEKPFSMIFAAFSNPESIRLVPATGIEMAIPAPANQSKSGGPGWKDIENLLSSAERDPDFDRKYDITVAKRAGKDGRHIFVSVGPSKNELFSSALHVENPPSHEKQRQVADRFLRWGRSQPGSPISSDAVLDEGNMFSETKVDNPRTRAAIRWALKVVGEPIPHEVSPESASERVFRSRLLGNQLEAATKADQTG